MKYTLPEFKKKEHTVRKNYVFIFDRLKHCKSAVDKLKKKSHSEILGVRRVTWSRFHTQDPQIGVTIKTFTHRGD